MQDTSSRQFLKRPSAQKKRPLKRPAGHEVCLRGPAAGFSQLIPWADGPLRGWRATATLIALLLTTTAAQARPRHARHTRTSQAARTTHAQRAAAQAAKEAALLKTMDPQMLVTMGKVKPFYDPTDLSKAPILNAASAVLMDADTGQILWSKNPDERRFPASTTKILTSLLFIEHTHPTDVVTCMDPTVTKIEESSLHIKPWEKFPAQDLLYGTLLRSANDGAVVMAEYVAGSVPKFADMMNEKARDLGATESHFVTPNGLPDPDHYTTAHDMALIARAAMQNPRFEDAVGTPERFIQRSILTRDSRIIAKAKSLFYDKFAGADGVKTGYTHAAGHCFVGSATRDGRRLLAVVLGAKNSAINDTIPLLSWGFQRFPATALAQRGQIEGEVPVAFGARGMVLAVAGADLHATTDSLVPDQAVTMVVEPAAGLHAPITRGQEVGKLVAKVGSSPVGEVPLLADGDVPRSTLSAALTGDGLFGRGSGILAGLCGAVLTVLIGFRYGPAALRFATASSGTATAAAAAPAKGARRRRDRVAPARRGDYRLR